MVDPGLGDDPVEDKGEAGRKEQPQAAGGGDQAQGKLLRVAILEHGRKQQAAQGKDGHPGGAGKGGENRTHHQGDHRQASRQPAQQHVGQIQQPHRRLAFGKHCPGKDKQGQGEQHGGIGQPGHLDDHHRGINAGAMKGQQGQGGHHHEERAAQYGQPEGYQLQELHIRA